MLKKCQYRLCIIYVVQGSEGGPIKVGRCGEGSLNDRLASLQVGNPNFLRVREKVHAQWLHEVRLRNELRAHFIRGEWYQAAALIQFQGLIASGFFAPVDVPDKLKEQFQVWIESTKSARAA